MGLSMGLYGPLQNVAYHHSCYSGWWSMGSHLMHWSKIFDSEFHLDFANVHTYIYLFELVHLGVEAVYTMQTCMEQYEGLDTNEYLATIAHGHDDHDDHAEEDT